MGKENILRKESLVLILLEKTEAYAKWNHIMPLFSTYIKSAGLCEEEYFSASRKKEIEEATSKRFQRQMQRMTSLPHGGRLYPLQPYKYKEFFNEKMRCRCRHIKQYIVRGFRFGETAIDGGYAIVGVSIRRGKIKLDRKEIGRAHV